MGQVKKCGQGYAEHYKNITSTVKSGIIGKPAGQWDRRKRCRQKIGMLL